MLSKTELKNIKEIFSLLGTASSAAPNGKLISLLQDIIGHVSAMSMKSDSSSLKEMQQLKNDLTENLVNYHHGKISTLDLIVICLLQINPANNPRDKQWTNFLSKTTEALIRFAAEAGYPVVLVEALRNKSHYYDVANQLLDASSESAEILLALYPYYPNSTYAKPLAMEALIKKYNKDKNIIRQCYRVNTDLMKYVSPDVLVELIKNKEIPFTYDLLKSLIKNPGIVKAFLESPLFSEEDKKTMAHKILKVFYEDEEVVSACLKIDLNFIQFASYDVIAKLVQNKSISVNDVLNRFPGNIDLMTACYRADPTILNALSHNIIVQLIERKILTPEIALQQHQNNWMIILACYRHDPDSIKGVNSATIAEMVKDGIIPGAEAVKRFPDNKDIILSAENQEKIVYPKSEKEVIEFIFAKKISPVLAVKFFPDNLNIVKAAYQIDRSSIVFASIDVINVMGENGVISQNEIRDLFPINHGDDPALSTEEDFNKALSDENYLALAKICNKFWFQKPMNATTEKVINTFVKDKKWMALYLFKKESLALAELNKKTWSANVTVDQTETISSGNPLDFGPLPKTPETYEFENLARKLMQSGDFKLQIQGEDEVLVFSDGTSFNWTVICKGLNVQHVNMGPQDAAAYYKFFSDQKLNAGDENQFNPYLNREYHELREADLRRAYYDKDKVGKPQDEGMINFAEAQALRQYSGLYYLEINSALRGEGLTPIFKLNNSEYCREALIYSAMAASGLNKAPQLIYDKVDRRTNELPDKLMSDLAQTGASGGTLTIQGFMSSSTGGDNQEVMNNLASLHSWEITDPANGLDLGYIAQACGEREFLLPPSQLQITGYSVNEKGSMTIQGCCVRALSNDSVRFDNIGVIEKSGSSLKYADVDAVIALVKEQKIKPELAVNAFPNNVKLIFICHEIDPTSICESYTDVAIQLKEIDILLEKLKTGEEGNKEVIKEISSKLTEKTDEIKNHVLNIIQGDAMLCKKFGNALIAKRPYNDPATFR